MKDIHGHGENCCSSCFHFILINYTFFVSTSWNWQAAGDSNKCKSLRLKFGLALLQLIMNDVILLIYRFISVHRWFYNIWFHRFIWFRWIFTPRNHTPFSVIFSFFAGPAVALPTNFCRTEVLWEKRAWACKYLGWLGWAKYFCSSWDVVSPYVAKDTRTPGFIWTQHIKSWYNFITKSGFHP